jgi:hypothetical protein
MQSSKIELTFRQFFENKSFTNLAQKSPNFDLHHQEYLKTKYLKMARLRKFNFWDAFCETFSISVFCQKFFLQFVSEERKTISLRRRRIKSRICKYRYESVLHRE